MARRGHNEGTIYHRADGRWEARLTLEGGKRKSLFGRTRQEAARKLAEALRDRDKGLPIVGERQTVAQYLASWLDVKVQTVDVGSWQRYEQQVRLHLVPELGDTRLARLTAQQVQLLYAHKLADGLSAQTVHHVHDTLKAALKDALRLGLLQRNVCELVDAPRVERAEIHPLTAEQAEALQHTVAGDRFEALFVVAIHCGLRQGELLALTWRDFDLEAATLTVRSSLQRATGAKRVKQPKTSHGRRQIALSTRAAAALRAHRTRQLEERLAAGQLWQEQDLVFPGPFGTPASYHAITEYHFKPALRRAELPDIRFHDLRHTCATLLLSRGVNVKVVSEMLGHADVAITLRVYAHVLPHMQRDAAVAMDRLFGSA
jgi:integrase